MTQRNIEELMDEVIEMLRETEGPRPDEDIETETWGNVVKSLDQLKGALTELNAV